jgi:hypothetical protein
VRLGLGRLEYLRGPLAKRMESYSCHEAHERCLPILTIGTVCGAHPSLCCPPNADHLEDKGAQVVSGLRSTDTTVACIQDCLQVDGGGQQLLSPFLCRRQWKCAPGRLARNCRDEQGIQDVADAVGVEQAVKPAEEFYWMSNRASYQSNEAPQSRPHLTGVWSRWVSVHRINQ